MSPEKYVASPVWFGYSGAKLVGPTIKQCILVDLDGSMLNNEHRQHFMRGEDKNWAGFFEAQSRDTAYPEVRFITNLIFMQSTVEVILVTGRPSQHHGVTLQTLSDENVNYSALIMRAQTDNRPDVEVKLDMLEGIRHQGFKPMFCIDDRPEVVGMWRSQGIPVLQCDPRDWDRQVLKAETLDKLKLMDENERLRARVQELEFNAHRLHGQGKPPPMVFQSCVRRPFESSCDVCGEVGIGPCPREVKSA